jgi:hypothetical protein
VMAHAERADVFEWLGAEGFTAVGTDRLREIVRR